MTTTQEKLPDTVKPPPQQPTSAATPQDVGPAINPYADPHDALITEYRTSSQFCRDPLGALLASENGKLFEFGAKYQALLDAGLARATTIADLRDLDPYIKSRLAIHRQCQMYAQLGVKIDDAERRAANRNSRVH
jgi:hypothetical protein